MATCNDCIPKDVCYLIEHYGRDLCSNDACDKFLAAPVVRGHWIRQDESFTRFKCSNPECGIENCSGFENYCPNCGAKMDGNEAE